MRAHPNRRRDTRHQWLRWVDRLLILSGVVALAWCAAIVIDGVIAQRAARTALEAETVARQGISKPVATSGTVLQPEAVRKGAPVAAIAIPRVGLSAVVLHGSDDQTLRRGPGHVENTAFPGQPGNVAIAGHRDSFFWPLRDIEVGDDVFLDTTEARIHYRVTSTHVVKPHDVSVLAPTDGDVLTLITCYPFWTIGNAPDRFIVRAVPIGNAAARAIATDDGILVRQAVERFRSAHNARATGAKGGAASPLRFKACDVQVTGRTATATCTGNSSGESPVVRTFRLERTSDGWAIRSVAHG